MTERPLEKVLITGGNGNLGRLVATLLESRGSAVVSFDLPGTEGPHSAVRHAEVLGDIRDTDVISDVLEAHRPDAVIHLASLLSGSSEADPLLAWEVNATASVGLMRAAHERGVGPFVFASSIATYGPDLPNPLPLDAPQWPENIYGATKVAVERMGVYMARRHGLDFRCLRFPMVLSPFAPPAALTAYPSHAFRAALTGQGFVFPVAPDTGMSNLFLSDVVSSLADLVAANRSRLRHPAYNLHAYHVTAEEVAETLRRRFPDFAATFQPDPAVDALVRGAPDQMDSSAAAEDWDWRPDFDFEQSADALIAMVGDEMPNGAA